MRYGVAVLTLLVMVLGAVVLGGVMSEDELLVSILDTHEDLAEVVDNAAEYRLQVVLGLVEEEPDGTPILRQHAFRAGAEYFYPASTVKLFAAVAAAQKVAELRETTGLAIDLDTPLVYHPQFEDGEMEAEDPDNVESGKITVRGQIREIFLISDNQAFNYLYELVGQDGLAESLRRAGFDSPRVVHRLSEFRSAKENLQSPRIDFVGEDFTYTFPERTAESLPPPEAIEGILVGEGYFSGDEKIDEPMDFSPKNHFPLVDLQRGLCMLVRPDVDCGSPGFELEEGDREAMLEAMSQYPRESKNPAYNPEEYPDTYAKFLLPGLERVVPREHLRIYSKTGQAYGFSTENAWVVNTATGQGFFLAATLYTNADGILNDDQYEYDEVALPFFADLGEAVARALWK
jgi:cell division protein FtsI/penicillin-binding protein 2